MQTESPKCSTWNKEVEIIFLAKKCVLRFPISLLLKTFSIAIVFFSCLAQSYAQTKADSIKQAISILPNDSIKIVALLKYSSVLEYTDNRLAYTLASEALDLAKTSNLKWAQANSYSRMAYVNSISGNFVESLRLDLLAASMYQEINDHSRYSEALNDVGVDYLDLGRYDYAYNYLRKSESISISLKDSLMWCYSTFNLGGLFNELNQYEKATEYLKLSAYLSRKFKIESDTAWMLHELGKIQMKTGHFAEAEGLLKNAIHQAHFYKIALLIPRAYQTLSAFYLATKDFNQASAYCDSLIQYARLYSNKHLIAQAHQRYGEIEYARGNFQKALTQLLEADKIFNELNAMGSVMQNKKLLAKAYGALGKMDMAFKANETYFLLNDSLTFATGKINVLHEETAIRLDELKKLKEVGTQQAEQIENRNTLLIIFIAALALLVFLSIRLFIGRTHQMSLNKKLQDINILMATADEELRLNLNELLVTQRELENTTKIAQEAKLEAEAASRAKSEFLANMSHEIRTPLNGVIGFTDILKESTLDANQKQYVSTVSESANILLSVVNDMLDFSKIEAGKLELTLTPVDLKQLGDQVLDMVALQAHAKNIKLVNSIHRDIPDLVLADGVRIKQVLVNLIGNAIKFTHHGEIELIIEEQNPDDSAERADDLADDNINLRFTVRDTGIGIQLENQQRIFEAFVQEDSYTTKRFGGTGLGLAISNKLLGMMNSTLQLKSTLGEGSVFSFDVTFKVWQARHDVVQPIPQSPQSSEEKTNNFSANLKILIVEDNPVNMSLIKIFLKNMLPNVTLIEAANGRLALEMWEQTRPDLVFMDVQMPEMNGYESAIQIREMEVNNSSVKRTPIIALTAGVLAGERDKCLAVGMDDYVSKPISGVALQRVLDHWLIKA